MLAAYRIRFEALTAATEELLTAVAALPHPSARPADGGWSGTQVVRHLLAAESVITTLLEKQAARPVTELRAAGLKSWLRSRLMSWLLNKPNRRFKAPARLGEPLGEEVDTEHLRQQWTTLRHRLGKLLAAYPASHGKRAVFQHPRAGWLTLSQTLRFMTDHVRHHQQQVARLKWKEAVNN